MRSCAPTSAAPASAPGCCTAWGRRAPAPWDASAPLAFVFSPLVGTPLTTSAKFAVVAKPPLTGMLTDALASSQFAIAGKLTGHDEADLSGELDRLDGGDAHQAFGLRAMKA